MHRTGDIGTDQTGSDRVGNASGIKRVGMLFSGGPAPAANAVISAAALSFLNSGIEVVGFFDGYEDLEAYSAELKYNHTY